MKVVVFSALFGSRDRLWSVPPVATSGASYILFTEKRRPEAGLWTQGVDGVGRPSILRGTGEVSPPVPTWEQRIVEVAYGNRGTARYYKTMAHEVLSEADISIWVDGNIRLLISPGEAVGKWLKGADLAVFKHPDRQCLFQEASVCTRWRKGDKERIAAQVSAYQEVGMPRDWGLASTRCVIRRHTERIARLNEMWWKEIRTYSVRDQISLSFTCWRANMHWEFIPGNATDHSKFWFVPHGEAV